MKVLLVHDFSGKTGGAELIVDATRKILEEKGHTVLLYAPDGPGPIAGAFFSIRHYFSLLKTISGYNPDIVHVHNIYRNVSPSVLLAAKRWKVPVVMTLHDFQIVCPKTSLVGKDLQSCETGFDYRCFYSNCYPRKPFNRIYQGFKALKLSLHRFIIRKTVRHFFSPSICLMDWTRNNLGVQSISLLPNFVAYECKYSPKPPSGNTLLFVGKLTEQKGVDILIKALAKVRQSVPDVRLRIVGEGPDEHNLKLLATSLRVSDLIIFTGNLPNAQVMKEYDDALLVIMPSKYAESFGIVGIEAMSKGKVVIVSRIGGLPDLVDDNETGFFVKPGDVDDLSSKIIYAARNRYLLHKMEASARTKYERCFSKPAYTRALLAMYHRVIQDKL